VITLMLEYRGNPVGRLADAHRLRDAVHRLPVPSGLEARIRNLLRNGLKDSDEAGSRPEEEPRDGAGPKPRGS